MIEAKPGINLGDGLAWLEAQVPSSLAGIFTDPPWVAGPADIAGMDNWKALLSRTLAAASRAVKLDGWIMLWYPYTSIAYVTREILAAALFLNAVIMVLGNVNAYTRGPANNIGLVFVASRIRQLPPIHTAIHKGALSDARLHPYEKPTTVITTILREWFKLGDRIADPFAGSNTTGWVAKRMGIDCFSFEINAEMYQSALEREKQMDLFMEEEG